MKRLFKITSIILIQAFLITNLSWTGGNNVLIEFALGRNMLSPLLQINTDAVKEYFASKISTKNIQAKENISFQIYQARENGVMSEVLVIENGYRVNIKVHSDMPVVLHWGINGWEKPCKEIWPLTENARTHFDEQTKAMRTGIKPSSSGDYVFSIDIPRKLVEQVNNIDFLFFCPQTGDYIRTKDGRDFSLPVRNALDLALESLVKGQISEEAGQKDNLLRLIAARIEKHQLEEKRDESHFPLFFDVRENIISQVVKTADGVIVDFWVISDEAPSLHWGINGWNVPPQELWPDKSGLYKDKALQTQMSAVSEDGLYQVRMHIPGRFLSGLKNINYNIFYPGNGHFDNNNKEDYNLSLHPKDIMAALLPYAKGRVASYINAKQARDLLKNMALSYAGDMGYPDLLELFKGLEETADLDAQDEKRDVLGLILIAKLMNEGAVWDSKRRKIIISKDKISASVAELIDKLGSLNVEWALYLFGLQDPSWISILSHQLDYKQIHEDVRNGKLKNKEEVAQFIQNIVNGYDDLEGAPKVISAESINETCLIIKLEFNGRIITTKWGYPTKREVYFYQGELYELRDIWGNEFSRVDDKFSRYVDKDAIKEQISRIHGKGKKAIVNGHDWQSPEVLTPDNYMLYHHNILKADADINNLLLSRRDPSTILELPDGKKVHVFHRPDSVDQLSPVLQSGTKAAEYWRNYWLEHYKYFIDEFDVDGFRIDLPGELNHHGDYSVIKSVFFEVIEYAASKGKRVYFVLETYHAYQNLWGWDEFSALNNDPQIQKHGYKPFRCYFKPIMTSIVEGDAAKLKSNLERVARDIQKLVISKTNFDEMRAEDIVPEKERLKRYLKLLYAFSRAGFDVLLYLRDLGLGDIVSMCGGDRIFWGGMMKYWTHRPATPRQFRDRLSKNIGQLMNESDLYQALKNSPQHPLSQILFRGNKLIFYSPGHIPEVFDLDKMSKPMPPVKLLDPEDDVRIWLSQHVDLPGYGKRFRKEALAQLNDVLSRHGSNGEAVKAVYEMICSGEHNFVPLDWEKNKTHALRASSDLVLAIDNGHPFVAEIREQGKNESRRIPALQIEKDGKYLALIFGMPPGKYTLKFLWPQKHADEGWEQGNGYEIEVVSSQESQAVAEYVPKQQIQPKSSFLAEDWQPPLREKISPVKNRRNKIFAFQMPVSGTRQKQGKHAGIGKWTRYASTYQRYNQATGSNAFLSQPINAVLNQARSWYEPISNFALNEALNDWDEVVDEFFPQLISQRPPYLESQGNIDYEKAEKRDALLSALIFESFLKEDGRKTLPQQFNQFVENNSWLDDYCKFRAFYEMSGNKPWWEWNGSWMIEIEQTPEFAKKKQFYAFSQFIAFKQWTKARKQIQAMGGKILYDKPYYFAKNSVEVWTSFRDNKGYFFHPNEKTPGIKSVESKPQIFYGLAAYKYAALRNNAPQPYELILKGHEYNLDVLGFNGGRIDAAHMVYPWTEEWLRSADEPGDELILAIKKVFDDRNNDLIILEQLGAWPDVMERIKDFQVYTMLELKWEGYGRIDKGRFGDENLIKRLFEAGVIESDSLNEKYVYFNKKIIREEQLIELLNKKAITAEQGHILHLWRVTRKVMVSLTSHDQPRIGDHYGDWKDEGYKHQFAKMFYSDAPIVYINSGEEYKDFHRMNNPKLLEEEQQLKYNWRWLLTHPEDPDYNQRMQSDLTPYIRSLAAEYLGDWDELFFQGADQARQLDLNAHPDLAMLINLPVNFELYKGATSDGMCAYVSGKAKDIFKLIYAEIAKNEDGEKILLHHDYQGDFFAFAENVLRGVPGLGQNEMPQIWEEINRLKNKDLPEYRRIASNIRLLGLMSGIFEKLNSMQEPESVIAPDFDLGFFDYPQIKKVEEVITGCLRSSNNFSYYDREIGWSNIAGEPHFHALGPLRNWGRDTMIALFEYAAHGNPLFKDTMKNYMRFVKNGLLPNLILGGENPSYSCVDASMWMMYALSLYLKASGDSAFLDEIVSLKFPEAGKNQLSVLEIMESVMAHYRNGTAKFGWDYMGSAAMDEKDKLIAAGNPDTFLTWMDGHWGDNPARPYSSRWGKPVEVNAFWCDALSMMSEIYARRGDTGKSAEYARLAKEAKTGFKRFWNEKKKCLFDTLDGNPDEGELTRSNQVWAVALGLFENEPEKERMIMDKVVSELLTVYGLRTRSPNDPGYIWRRDSGNGDIAYHHIVWPWTMGSFIQAAIKVYGRKETFNILNKAGYFDGLAKQIKELKTIAEIYNGDCKLEDGPNKTGCWAGQAWSVRETLRGLSLLFPGLFSRALKSYRQERLEDPVWTFKEKIIWLEEGKSFKIRHFAPGTVHAGVMDFATNDWSNIRDIPLEKKGDFWEAEIPGDVNVFTFKWPNAEPEKLFYVIKRVKTQSTVPQTQAADLTFQELGPHTEEINNLSASEAVLCSI